MAASLDSEVLMFHMHYIHKYPLTYMCTLDYGHTRTQIDTHKPTHTYRHSQKERERKVNDTPVLMTRRCYLLAGCMNL